MSRVDLWLIETAQPGMSIDRIRSACFRTGQFVGEDFLSREQAEQEILRSIALNNGLEMNADLQSLIVGTLNDGTQNAGWSHYRIERA